MLARLARELPVGAWSYEPKWDGFRCVASVSGGTVRLHSRHGRPLERYFPEVAQALGTLPDAVLDGELVILADGVLADFAALLARLHPSVSRAERLSRETPASFVAFDLVAHAGEDLTCRPFVARRARLEALLAGRPPPLLLTPTTRDPAMARSWLELGPRGVDGVVAKHDALTYQPGRRAMVKVKALRTVECVVAGFRRYAGEPPEVASLLLGMYDGPRLRHVGVSSSFSAARRRELVQLLFPRAAPLSGHPWERGFNLASNPAGRLGGSAGRWDPRSMSLDWTPLRPELVCEVTCDRVDGFLFRHPARFLRWRPDREPRSCTLDQLRPPAERAGDAPGAPAP